MSWLQQRDVAFVQLILQLGRGPTEELFILEVAELTNDEHGPDDDVDNDEEEARDPEVPLACLFFQNRLAILAHGHFFLIEAGAELSFILVLFAENHAAAVLLEQNAHFATVASLVHAVFLTARSHIELGFVDETTLLIVIRFCLHAFTCTIRLLLVELRRRHLVSLGRASRASVEPSVFVAGVGLLWYALHVPRHQTVTALVGAEFAFLVPFFANVTTVQSRASRHQELLVVLVSVALTIELCSGEHFSGARRRRVVSFIVFSFDHVPFF